MRGADDEVDLVIGPAIKIVNSSVFEATSLMSWTTTFQICMAAEPCSRLHGKTLYRVIRVAFAATPTCSSLIAPAETLCSRTHVGFELVHDRVACCTATSGNPRHLDACPHLKLEYPNWLWNARGGGGGRCCRGELTQGFVCKVESKGISRNYFHRF